MDKVSFNDLFDATFSKARPHEIARFIPLFINQYGINKYKSYIKLGYVDQEIIVYEINYNNRSACFFMHKNEWYLTNHLDSDHLLEHDLTPQILRLERHLGIQPTK